MAKRYDWSKPVSSLLHKLQQKGFKMVNVYDGEGYEYLIGNNLSQRKSATSVIVSVDESRLTVEKNNLRGRLYIILGNEPSELVCDWGSASGEIMEELETVVNAHSEQWEGKKCPMVNV